MNGLVATTMQLIKIATSFPEIAKTWTSAWMSMIFLNHSAYHMAMSQNPGAQRVPQYSWLMDVDSSKYWNFIGLDPYNVGPPNVT